jgi:hypothetical protein
MSILSDAGNLRSSRRPVIAHFAALVTVVCAAVLPLSVASTASAATIDYYRFEAGPSGATVTDVEDSGSKLRPGSLLSGAPTFDSAVPANPIPKTGQADHFSASMGTGDSFRFHFAFPFQKLTSATLEFWVNPASTSAENDIFWTTTAANSGDANRFNIGLSPGGAPFIDYREPNGTLHPLGISSVAVPAGEWTFIAYVKSGLTYLIYINGSVTNNVTKKVSAKTDTSPNLPTSTGWTLNGRFIEQPLNCCQFSGLIDEIRISNRALGPAAFLVH